MLKKFLIGAFFVAAFALVASSASADCTITTTLKVGSTGTEVSCLQTKVGATADGSFGPMTKASVMAYQASHGLSADGVVGPLSRAVLNASVIPVAVTFAPAGCTSASGYSPLLGLAGGLCHVAGTPAAGCQTGWLFNPMTGLSCTSGSTNPVVTTGPLTGGAGDAIMTHYATSEKGTIKEGDSGVKVLGFRVEAQDSDIALQNIKVSIVNTDFAATGDSSYRIDRYLDSVDVYMGSTKVGSADVADFTKSVNTYSKSIALSNAVIRNGDKTPFYVVFNAISSMDTANESAVLVVNVDSYRFQDATGVIMTNNLNSDDVTNDVTINTSADALTLLSSSNSPDNSTVKVDESSTTDEVPALVFKLKAGSNSSDITLDTLPIIVNIRGAASTTSSAKVIDSIIVKIGSKTITADAPTSTGISNQDETGSDVTYTADFSNEGIVIAAGETIEAKVYITFVEQGGTGLSANYADGLTKVTASINGNEVTAESNNSDTITSSSEQTGAILTLSTTAATVTTSSPTSDKNTDGTVGTFSFTFKVTANNGVVGNIDARHLAYEILGPTGQTATVNPAVTKLSGTATLDSDTGIYTVADGDNATFTLDVTITPADSGDNGVYRVHLTTVAGNSVDLTAGPQTLATTVATT